MAPSPSARPTILAWRPASMPSPCPPPTPTCSSAIQQANANGTQTDDIKASGPAAGLAAGYIIPSASVPLNFGLRYEHVFVSDGAPAQSMIAFRVAWSLLTARRLKGN